MAKIFQGFEQQQLLFVFNVETETLEITKDNPCENKTLVQLISCKFCEIFKNIFSREHFHVTTSDIRMQIVVIYNLNLSLQFCNGKLYTLP